MERSIITFALLVFTLAAQAWSLTIKSDKARSAIKQSNDAVMKRGLENGAAQQYDMDELRRSYAILLDSMKSAQQKDRQQKDHPFGFGLSRSSAFHGKKRDYFRPAVRSSAFHGKKDVDFDVDEPEDQNTSVFHGKRNEDLMAEWLANNQQDEFPSRSSVFHGKKDMNGVMRYLLKDLEGVPRKHK
jgi:hypothetical protein